MYCSVEKRLLTQPVSNFLSCLTAIVFGENENDNTLIDLNISSEHFFNKAPAGDQDEYEDKDFDDCNI